MENENIVIEEEVMDVTDEVLDTEVPAEESEEESGVGLGTIALIGLAAVAAGAVVVKGVKWGIGKIKDYRKLKNMKLKDDADKLTKDDEDEKEVIIDDSEETTEE